MTSISQNTATNHLSTDYTDQPFINSCPPSAAYMRQWTGSALVQMNGLSPDWRQAIIRTNAGIFLIGPLGTNFSEIQIEIKKISFMKMRLKLSSEKLWPFCWGGDELTIAPAWQSVWSVWQAGTVVWSPTRIWTYTTTARISPLSPHWSVWPFSLCCSSIILTRKWWHCVYMFQLVIDICLLSLLYPLFLFEFECYCWQEWHLLKLITREIIHCFSIFLFFSQKK